MKTLIFSAFFLLMSFTSKSQSCTQTPYIWLGGIVNCNLNTPYKLVFHDEFNGTSLDLNKWHTFYPYGANSSDQCEFCRTHGNEGQIYKDENVLISNGTLKLKAKKENATWYTATRQFTSGMVQSKQNFKYGKFEIRCKLPPGQGFWPAFWLFGGDECDVFEYCTNEPTKQNMNLHIWCNNQHYQIPQSNTGINSTTDYHTYSVEWEPMYVDWRTDG